MKRLLLILTFLAFANATQAQSASVENSVSGIQAGFLGAWFHTEFKLADDLVLRSEIGFDSGFWAEAYSNRTGYVFAPVITLEPRHYYNLDKRLAKSKNIAGNSGNFISLKTSYHPDWFVVSNHEQVEIISDISVIPTWGIRRVLGRHFTYEVGAGAGYRYTFAKQAGYLRNQSETAFNLHLRVGYNF